MELSRRELVAAFLGQAVAASACLRPPPRVALPGELMDAHLPARGHALRDGPPPPLAAALAPVDVLVVGGGVAGLSAAWRLAGAGLGPVPVLELDVEPGGTARSGRGPAGPHPWGAHYLPAPLHAGGPVVRMLRELGLVAGVGEDGRPHYAEEALVAEPAERVFYRGHWYEGLYLRAGAGVEDLAQLRRFEAEMEGHARARDGRGRKAFDVPVARSSDDAEWTQLDRVTMAAWLEARGYTSPRLRWLVDYACRDDYGAPADAVSAWAGIWYFAARSDGSGRPEGHLTWPEGNGRLVAHLAQGARLTTGALVHTVAPQPDGRWAVHALGADGAPRGYLARQVVVAAPRFIAARLVVPWRGRAPAWLADFRYGPWVVANVTLSQPPRGRGFPLAWDNVLYESRSLGYVVSTHQHLRQREDGPTTLTWYLPLDGADVKAERARALSQGLESWQRLALADLSAAHPGIAQGVERVDVMRWGHAMVRPVPGFLWGAARRAAGESLGGSLHFAHSDLGGMALFEEAQWSGVRAAEAVLRGLGRTSDSWL